MKVFQQSTFTGTVGEMGEVRITAEELEDLWHVYNLVYVGDIVTALAVRKVQHESKTGSVDSQRVKLNLAISVEKIDFDPAGEEVRLSGLVRNECEGVRLGSRHTLTLECHRQFVLRKEEWDSVSLARLKDAAADPDTRADLWAILMREGFAQLCHVTGGMTIVKAKLEAHIPTKGDPRVLLGAKTTRQKWFEQLLSAVMRHVNFNHLRCMVLAGPGFTKDSFWEWMVATAAKREMRVLNQSKPKWIVTHASSAYKHALKELFRDPAIAARVADTRAGGEVAALSEFLQTMSKSPDSVTYGLRHVQAAMEQQAISKLLLVDSLFRSQNVQRRAEYVALSDGCKDAGAKVLIFSDQHPSGVQLTQMSGVAAILRFPLPLEDLEEDESDESSESEIEDNEDGVEDELRRLERVEVS